MSERTDSSANLDHALEASFIPQQRREETLVSIRAGKQETSAEYIDIDVTIRDECLEGEAHLVWQSGTCLMLTAGTGVNDLLCIVSDTPGLI